MFSSWIWLLHRSCDNRRVLPFNIELFFDNINACKKKRCWLFRCRWISSKHACILALLPFINIQKLRCFLQFLRTLRHRRIDFSLRKRRSIWPYFVFAGAGVVAGDGLSVAEALFSFGGLDGGRVVGEVGFVQLALFFYFRDELLAVCFFLCFEFFEEWFVLTYFKVCLRGLAALLIGRFGFAV